MKEKFTATFHFCLHGSAPLKCLATPDDQSEIMSAEPAVCIGRVFVRIPRTAEDSSNLDSTLQTLFPKSQALKLLQAVLLRCAVYDCIPEKVFTNAGNITRSLGRSATTSVFWIWGFHCILELPSASTFVVQQTWVIVALVEIFENTRKDFGFFIGKTDPLALSLEKLTSTSRRKEWRQAKDVLMCRKKSSLATDRDGDDR